MQCITQDATLSLDSSSCSAPLAATLAAMSTVLRFGKLSNTAATLLLPVVVLWTPACDRPVGQVRRQQQAQPPQNLHRKFRSSEGCIAPAACPGRIPEQPSGTEHHTVAGATIVLSVPPQPALHTLPMLSSYRRWFNGYKRRSGVSVKGIQSGEN